MIEIKNLDLSRCDSLRHIKVNFHSINRALPDRPFHDFISTISSPQLKTCLILSYDNDLDELKTLLETPKPKDNPTLKKEEKPKRDVRITFGLDIEKEEAEDYQKTIRTALDCAVKHGVFEFLTNTPALEVYPRVWNPTA